MRKCAAKAQILSKCRIRHSSQSAYFDAVALASDAVSGLVQRRCERTKPALPRDDGDHPTTDPAFAGQPGLIQPVSGILVEAGGHHDGQDVLAVDGINNTLHG